MIKDSAKRLFDMIIVWKLDRFARNRFDSAYYKYSQKERCSRGIRKGKYFRRCGRHYLGIGLGVV